MQPELIALIFFGIALVLLLLGVQVGLVLAISGALGIWVVTGNFASLLGILKTTSYSTVAIVSYTVVPLFILMGEFSLHGTISERAYKAIAHFLGGLPGALLVATVWACVAFGATSGSFVAAGSVFTKLSLPEAKKAGYNSEFMCAGIATAAIIAMVIPPSLLFVVYAMLAEVSIAAQLLAGVIPGLLLAVILSIGIVIQVIINPKLAPRTETTASFGEKLLSLANAWPIVVLAAIIIGGIYTGLFTATEAAAIGAVVALVISIGFRKMDWQRFKNSVVGTAHLTAVVFLIIIGATIFARFLTISGIGTLISEGVVQMQLSPVLFVIAVVLVGLVMGCFIDGMSIMCITLPIFLPIARSMSIDLIWLGVLVVMAMCIGAITPPFGLSVYTVKAVAGEDVRLEDIFRAAMPLLFPLLVIMIFLIAFPQMSLIIPSIMGGK